EDLLPQAVDVRLAEDLPRPALARRTGAAPVDRVLPKLLEPELPDLALHSPADALAVEIGQQLRLRIARRRDQGVARKRGDERLQPFGRVRERFVRPELDHRPPGVRVVVEDVDVGGACTVGLPCEGAREVVVLDRRVEEELLTRLDVRTDADDELRIAVEPFVHRPRSYVVRHARLAACASFKPASGTGKPRIPSGRPTTCGRRRCRRTRATTERACCSSIRSRCRKNCWRSQPSGSPSWCSRCPGTNATRRLSQSGSARRSSRLARTP